jgi:endonuclease/exonuclease/phosphatase (EEP) superfamily protein YafD
VIASILTGLSVAPFTAWALVRLAGLERGWPLVPLMAFTPYAGALSVLPLAVALAAGRTAVAAVAALSTAALAWCVLPRAFGRPDPPAGGPPLRVLASNLLFGAADVDELLDLVRTQAVDLLAVQECTPEADKALRSAGICALLPHRIAHPQDEPGGSALYSRFPLAEGGYRPLPPYFGQSYATVRVPGAAEVLVESVHPCAPSARRVLGHWRAGLSGQPGATPTGPVRVLLGDFNATVDHAALRRLLRTGYRHAASVVGTGLAGTWPCAGARLPKVAIDHVLVDPRVAVHAVRVYPIAGTDHRAVLAELSLPPVPLP